MQEWKNEISGTIGNFENDICEHIKMDEQDGYGQKSFDKVLNIENVILTLSGVFSV